MKKYRNHLCIIFVISISLQGIGLCQTTNHKGYYFDNDGISREVLDNYLSKAITMAFFLVPYRPEGNRTYPYHTDDIRMVMDIEAKFIGRSIYRWGEESILNEKEFWNTARQIIGRSSLGGGIDLFNESACPAGWLLVH
ncbi:hypothetical protein [Echinicola shivajiensis]|uniref:hypothetical protein n=1 Tax=Echinicola shivajiensis TaxID=1035916 RepID=UPI001BFC8744|nr:hypothetical protein [Echinicola shivajiensis]